MKKITLISLVFILLISCSREKDIKIEKRIEETNKIIAPVENIALFNGENLSNWILYVPDSTIDVNTIWSVSEGILSCTGAVNGYIRTENQYKDYMLTLEWRWSSEPGNSGVLLHMNGDDKVWPRCIEAQLQSGNAGDFYLIDGTSIAEQTDPNNRRVVKQAESSEVDPGEWNRYEIYCSGNTIELKVNGILQNTATDASVQSGFICLQSEGKPIEFRNITLEPLK